MQIDRFLRPGKRLVVELDDGVDYLIDEEAVANIRAGKTTVVLTRLVDNSRQRISVRRLSWALENKDAIDYIDAC